MFKFPKNLYTDVRIEEVFNTDIKYEQRKLEDFKASKHKAVFIRVFDGNIWHYASTTNVDNIQEEIDKLAKKAIPNEDINNNPIVMKYQVNKEKVFKYDKENDVTKVSRKDKMDLIESYFKFVDSKYLKVFTARYVDFKKIISFYSSKGTEIEYDTQKAGFKFVFALEHEGENFADGFSKDGDNFSFLNNLEEDMVKRLKQCEDALLNAQPVEPGKYTVIMSPITTGVFAHESFGHKSEADFMVGNETMKKEWAIGKKVGSDILTIVDYGMTPGSGYVPFDDEGTKTEETFLIKNGILSGRLHSVATAVELDEELTGNARAVSFEFEPIVRMTSTYILGGDKTKEELFNEVEDGIYIETIKHGSGMSTFTIAPSLAYRVKNGKITNPVKIAVITGNVFETLGEVDGLSNECEVLSFVLGGCGKMEQFPLPVGMGGPYMRVKNINVR
ncbi:TldD/PmbA family protein [Clostridiaceae bacterium M8S5]|nr:TldD/PmbA family protein [Clostridiaceae bacterium M8S5]